MSPQADSRYLTWLYSQVELDAGDSHWRLMDVLHRTEFDDSRPNDSNRSTDGVMLRDRFISETRFSNTTPEWHALSCSMLEMLVALSERMAFQLNGDTAECFWDLLNNVGLNSYDDSGHFDAEEVQDILECINDRSYDSDGHGGFFPLSAPIRDQRDVELLYQMYAYIQEGN